MAMLSFGRNLKMLPVGRNMRLPHGNAQFRTQSQNAPSLQYAPPSPPPPPMAMLSFGRNLKMLPVRRNMRLLDGNAQFRMQPQNAPSRFSLQALGFFPGTDTMRPGCSSHTTSQQAISKRKPTTLRIPRRSPIQVLTQPKVA